ncbi:MAG: Ig-like domain-containing protein, partial [Methanosarcinales archaeon]|nr:Ig-like domain-containing protein [Methanosarcinales archaeon]
MISPGIEGNYAANLALNNAGTNIQLYQTGVTLEPDTRYRLSFAGYSTIGHDVNVRLIKHVSPYTNYGLDFTANLGTNWQNFTTEFNTTGFTGTVNDGRLMFWLAPFATAGDTYNFDNVRLEKVDINDTTPPTVTGNEPTGTNVPVTTQISVTFSEAMNKTSVENAFDIDPSVNGTFTWSTMNFNPDANLTPNTLYNVTIGTGAEDLAGNNLSTAYLWNFTTATPSDTTDPVVNTVTLNTTTPNTGDAILVTVNATDHVGVTNVTVGSTELSSQGGNIWNGTITALAGPNSVNVSAKDAAGNIGWNNSTSYTATTPSDTTDPVVNTVTLNTTTPNTGDAILVTVNATDHVGVTNVTVGSTELSSQGGNIWNGTITALAGPNSVNVSAKDAAGNIGWNNSTSYTATT